MIRSKKTKWLAKAVQLKLEKNAVQKQLRLYESTVQAHEQRWGDKIHAASQRLDQLERRKLRAEEIYRRAQQGQLPEHAFPQDLRRMVGNRRIPQTKRLPTQGFPCFVKEQHEKALREKNYTWLKTPLLSRFMMAAHAWRALAQEERERYVHMAEDNRHTAAGQQVMKKTLSRLELKSDGKVRRKSLKESRAEENQGSSTSKARRKGKVVSLSTGKALSGYAKFVAVKLRSNKRVLQGDDAAAIPAFFREQEAKWERMSEKQRAKYT